MKMSEDNNPSGLNRVSAGQLNIESILASVEMGQSDAVETSKTQQLKVPERSVESEVNDLKREREEKELIEKGDAADSPPGHINTKRRRIEEETESEKKLNNENWHAMYNRLVVFKEQHGHCLVPKRYTEDPKLGTWVETQRVQYKRLDRDVCEQSGLVSITPNKRLCSERLQLLDAIGFAWSAKSVKKTKSPALMPAPRPLKKGDDSSTKAAAKNRWHDAIWEEYFDKLKAYKEKHGDTLVPRKYELAPKLATWVETQRALWNRDFKQEIDTKSSTDAGATQGTAETSAETDGELKPPGVTDGVLMDINTGKLPAKRLTLERKKRLDELGFVWSLRHKRIADHWQNMFEQLVEYKNKHGDCLVPSRYEENVKLGKWVETQRYEYTKLRRSTETEETKSTTDDGDVEFDLNAGAAPDNTGASGAKGRTPNPRLTQVRILQLESIGFEWRVKQKMKRYYDKQWESMLERLLAYKAKHGHCNVPKRYKDDPKLGTWVHTQRIQFRKYIAGTAKKEGDTAEFVASGEIKKEEEISYRLTEDRRKRLEAVGFLWSTKECEKAASESGKITRNSYDNQWDGMFARLVAFKEQNGHCLVPKRYQLDPKLGTWVDTQRVQYKKMKKKLAEQGQTYEGPGPEEDGSPSNMASKPLVGRLTDDRISRLESIGFTWSLRDDWQKHYDELKEFKAESGHCNVPARYVKNRRLGIWVSAQRQQYKLLKAPVDPSSPKRSSPLTPDRIELLDQLGFVWVVRSRDSPNDAWNMRYDALRRYQEEHGDCLVPLCYPPNNELGIFVHQQRVQYRLYMESMRSGTDPALVSELTQEKISKLEDIRFIFDNDIIGEEGKENEQDHLMAAGAMMANFRQQNGLISSSDFEEDRDDSALQEALQKAEVL